MMHIKELAIEHHNRIVYGKVYLPEGIENAPIVIFSHGYNGCMEDFDISARYFAENGIGAVCYTFCGGSTRDKSSFHTTEMTIFTEKEDLSAVVDTISKWDCVNEENIFLFGGSMGGLVSALVAEDYRDKIKGLILLYPALCIADNWRENYPSKEDIPDTQEFWGMMLGRKFFESIHTFYVFDQIGKFRNNVLIMHGRAEAVVPIEYSIRAKSLYPNAELELFASEGHGFTEEGNRRMEAMALYFVHQCMNKEL